MSAKEVAESKDADLGTNSTAKTVNADRTKFHAENFVLLEPNSTPKLVNVSRTKLHAFFFALLEKDLNLPVNVCLLSSRRFLFRIEIEKLIFVSGALN